MINSIRNRFYLKKLKRNGLIVGDNFNLEKGAKIDKGFPWLICIGNNVTLAPFCYILAHDGSTKKFINYTKIGKVKIGNNVFVGAYSIILPGIKIGNNVVIGAGSVVTNNIEDNSVVCGVPAKKISSLDAYLKKNKMNMKKFPKYGKEYTLYGGISKSNKERMKRELEKSNGFIT